MEAGRQVVKRRRLDQPAWREVLQRFDGAGMTVEDFCRAEGLCRSSFTRWRRRLRTPAEAARPVAVKAVKQEAPAAFVDLGLLGGAGAALLPALDLRIELGGGVVLHLVRR
jgi:hypothetical protein